MDPVEEFARLKREVTERRARMEQLRARFLEPGARLVSNSHEIVVREQDRRVFLRDRLPHHILRDPSFWEVRRSPVVTVRALSTAGRLCDTEDDLFEPF